MLRNKPAPVDSKAPVIDRPQGGPGDLHLRRFPIGGAIGALVARGDEWVVPAKDFQGLASDKPDLLIMRIAGNDLEPDLRAGDLVVADRHWNVVSAAGTAICSETGGFLPSGVANWPSALNMKSFLYMSINQRAKFQRRP